jgi:hypothetical protein
MILRRTWQRLFPPPLVIDDPFFGRLLFMPMPELNNAYWEGKVRFEPTNAEIEVFVDASEAGPGTKQRAFYQRIQARFGDLCDALDPVLRMSYRAWFDRPAPDAIWDVFTLTSISIPREDSPESEWDISFDCSEDREHMFTVHMVGWTPMKDVTIDG